MADDLILQGKKRNLGSFSVVRSLPQAQCRSVGPFVFLDHMGPLKVSSSSHLDVNPHPHIGLSTVTYLISGRGFHRDSLGYSQLIEPGDLNWMTAGRGIVHSERSPEGEVTDPPSKELNGIQIWVSLPKEHEDCEPHFTHYSKEVLPRYEFTETLEGKVLIGKHNGVESPVFSHSRMLFMEMRAKAEGVYKFSVYEEQAALFVLQGSVSVNNSPVPKDDLIVVADPLNIHLQYSSDAIVFLIAGKSHPEERYIWWNFVSSSKEKIRAAIERWEKKEFPLVPGEHTRTELPDIPRI